MIHKLHNASCIKRVHIRQLCFTHTGLVIFNLKGFFNKIVTNLNSLEQLRQLIFRLLGLTEEKYHYFVLCHQIFTQREMFPIVNKLHDGWHGFIWITQLPNQAENIQNPDTLIPDNPLPSLDSPRQL